MRLVYPQYEEFRFKRLVNKRVGVTVKTRMWKFIEWEKAGVPGQ